MATQATTRATISPVMNDNFGLVEKSAVVAAGCAAEVGR